MRCPVAKEKKDTSKNAEREVMYSRISHTNARWVREVKYRHGMPISDVFDALIESARLGRPFEIKPFTPAYIARAIAITQKRKDKLKALRQPKVKRKPARETEASV